MLKVGSPHILCQAEHYWGHKVNSYLEGYEGGEMQQGSFM